MMSPTDQEKIQSAPRLKRKKHYQLRRKKYAPAPSLEEGGKTDERFSELNEQNEGLKEELAVMKDQFLRVKADIENQRKRFVKEKDALREYVTEDVVATLLPAIDNLDHAIDAAQTTHNLTALKEGVELVRQEFGTRFGQLGVEIINQKDVVFDPTIHDAVAVDITDEIKENTVTEVIRKGYKINNRVIRAAMVKVSKRRDDTDKKSDS